MRIMALIVLLFLCGCGADVDAKTFAKVSQCFKDGYQWARVYPGGRVECNSFRVQSE